MNIAIDGPAGAGKSTIARKLAEKLGYIYVDTGAMYRAMALCVLNQGIDAKKEAQVVFAAEEADISIQYQQGEQQVILNGENVTGQIRKEAVSRMASSISVYPAVRKKLVALQQKLAKTADVIMDGRDIGTCVLPDAKVKIYLTASVEARAKRRFLELTEKGADCNLDEIKKDIEERDYRDMHREASPLKQAEDAVLVDSSNMNIEEVVEAILNIWQERQ
ncbi:MAG: (d)CMP kinase [Lachnospiraceae bacterium]|nr:(d)CMP kinase [Lachnospiraceae bacterium]